MLWNRSVLVELHVGGMRHEGVGNLLGYNATSVNSGSTKAQLEPPQVCRLMRPPAHMSSGTRMAKPKLRELQHASGIKGLPARQEKRATHECLGTDF